MIAMRMSGREGDFDKILIKYSKNYFKESKLFNSGLVHFVNDVTSLGRYPNRTLPKSMKFFSSIKIIIVKFFKVH